MTPALRVKVENYIRANYDAYRQERLLQSLKEEEAVQLDQER